MNFAQSVENIESLFGNTAWTTNNIKTFPQNYQGEIGDPEWVRVNIFQGTSVFRYQGGQSVGGLVNCNIFVPVGQGIRRANQIADLLETLFRTNTISGVQTTNSFTTNVGVDSENSGLYRLDFTVNFNNYN